MKIISWNVNGIRAAVKKDFVKSMIDINPDIICLQETKAQDDQVVEALSELSGYHIVSNSATKKGYSGVSILSKEKPISTEPDMGIEAHDDEGRILTAEFENFHLTTVYVPNSKRGLARLDYRQQWDTDFASYLKNLQDKKPVIVCGDLNVAHSAIDLANPKSNYNKTAGYTQTEIDGLSGILGIGMVDSFRHLYPDKEGAYSWWSYMFNSRAKNVGWRIDYFLISNPLIEKMKDSFILPDIHGSDHCPVGLDIELG